MNEFDLIKKHFAPLAGSGAYGLKDDAATVQPSADHELVLTTDAILEGVHFVGDERPQHIAKKLLRVNLSDLAAKGTKPLGYLLTCIFPRNISENWISAFAEGLKQDQQEFGVTLLGGDTTATPGKLALSLTMIGEVPMGNMLKRSGAEAGDDIYLSGTLGDSALGLLVRQGKYTLSLPDDETNNAHYFSDYLITRYELPTPRLTLGQKLLPLAHAAMDVSDGLAQDAGHIASASDVGMEIDTDKLPFSPAVRLALMQDKNLLPTLISGGDDYEILFTAPPAHASALKNLSAELALPITRIGKVTAGNGVKLLANGRPPLKLPHGGYNHFS